MEFSRVVLVVGVLASALLLAGWWISLHISNSASKSLTKEEAQEIAEREISIDSRMALIENLTEEHDFGWVFFRTSKKYLETKNPNDIIPGNGPLIVNRDGTVVHLSTAADTDTLIDQYERER